MVDIYYGVVIIKIVENTVPEMHPETVFGMLVVVPVPRRWGQCMVLPKWEQPWRQVIRNKEEK